MRKCISGSDLALLHLGATAPRHRQEAFFQLGVLLENPNLSFVYFRDIAPAKCHEPCSHFGLVCNLLLLSGTTPCAGWREVAITLNDISHLIQTANGISNITLKSATGVFCFGNCPRVPVGHPRSLPSAPEPFASKSTVLSSIFDRDPGVCTYPRAHMVSHYFPPYRVKSTCHCHQTQRF